jgi:hypothetical protein
MTNSTISTPSTGDQHDDVHRVSHHGPAPALLDVVLGVTVRASTVDARNLPSGVRARGADGETRTLTAEDLNLVPLPIGLRRRDRQRTRRGTTSSETPGTRDGMRRSVSA